MRLLHATAGHDAEKGTTGEAYADSTEVVAALQMRLKEADPTHRGMAWLEFTADTGVRPRATHLLIRLPLATSVLPAPASATCTADGRTLIYTASTQATSSQPFRPATGLSDDLFSLSRNLCQAIAVTYDCNGTAIAPSKDWKGWRLARSARMVLSSDVPATLELSPVAIIATEKPFTAASCHPPKP